MLVGRSEVAVRADRARRQLGVDERRAAPQLVQLLLEARELAGWQQGNAGQRGASTRAEDPSSERTWSCLRPRPDGPCCAAPCRRRCNPSSAGQASADTQRRAVRSGPRPACREPAFAYPAHSSPIRGRATAPFLPETNSSPCFPVRRPAPASARPRPGPPGSSSAPRCRRIRCAGSSACRRCCRARGSRRSLSARRAWRANRRSLPRAEAAGPKSSVGPAYPSWRSTPDA